MQAMILAAGRGTRLGELGRHTAKALVEIDGRPLLDRQLERLERQGVKVAVVNAHHLAEQIIAHVAHRRGCARTLVSLEPELLGTAGGVRAALHHFDPTAPLLVLHADTILDAPLAEIAAAHQAAGAEATICANWLGSTLGKGLIEADERGWVTAFAEKPPHGPAGLANAGLYVIEPALLDPLAPGTFADFGFDVFPAALARGARLRVHRLDAPAHDIGTPESLIQAQRMVMYG